MHFAFTFSALKTVCPKSRHFSFIILRFSLQIAVLNIGTLSAFLSITKNKFCNTTGDAHEYFNKHKQYASAKKIHC